MKILSQLLSCWTKKLTRDNCSAVAVRRPYLVLRAGKAWIDGILQEQLPWLPTSLLCHSMTKQVAICVPAIQQLI